jgi:hypothetical protein
MRSLTKFLFIAALLILPLTFLSQPPDPPGGGTPPCGGPFGGVCPIDGGVSLLVAAGLALGGKKAYDVGKKRRIS